MPLGKEKFEDGKDTWLTFTSNEVALVDTEIPIVGVQIPLQSDWDTPFNVFWWGKSDAEQLKRFTLQLVAEDQKLVREEGQGEPADPKAERAAYIRSVCYGRDWKKIEETELGKDPPVQDRTLNLRFEYVPDQPRNPTEAAGKIMTWARFHSIPAPNDIDAVESVGLLLPYRLFARMETDIWDSFVITSVRSVKRALFNEILDAIKMQFKVDGTRKSSQQGSSANG